MVPDISEVESKIQEILADFPGAKIEFSVNHCRCKSCQKHPHRATMRVSMIGTRADGRPLEPAFGRIKIKYYEWETWDARANLIRFWLMNQVTVDFPKEIKQRLGLETTARIILYELCD
jgi:hypothetical protein